ncbi:hypothetical protein HPP92_002512 [Vanilla planifolia]|uniref:Uncharacterized protein n=1 Tax=Vanilla planifolia TaxID=51239 RepID=A0A835S8N1_VANPL|nr:hypothetical protein HPP92_002512 [Vanilla planifolia]
MPRNINELGIAEKSKSARKSLFQDLASGYPPQAKVGHARSGGSLPPVEGELFVGTDPPPPEDQGEAASGSSLQQIAGQVETAAAAESRLRLVVVTVEGCRNREGGGVSVDGIVQPELITLPSREEVVRPDAE